MAEHSQMSSQVGGPASCEATLPRKEAVSNITSNSNLSLMPTADVSPVLQIIISRRFHLDVNDASRQPQEVDINTLSNLRNQSIKLQTIEALK